MEIFHFLIYEEVKVFWIFLFIVCLFLRVCESQGSFSLCHKKVISLDYMDSSELLKGFSFLTLDFCKLLSESIHVCVVAFSPMACWEFKVVALSSIPGDFIKGFISVTFQFLMAASIFYFHNDSLNLTIQSLRPKLSQTCM